MTFYRLRNIFNFVLPHQRHLTAGPIYNDFVFNCRNRFNEAAVAAAVAAGFDGAAAAAVAVSTSFLNESDREVKAEPREPGTVDIYEDTVRPLLLFKGQ